MRASYIEPLELTEGIWQAIVHNDGGYDGKLYYGVATTRIFCRPSCKSRVPKRENVRLFRTAEQALTAEFHPCKRCRPTGQQPDQEWVEQMKGYIEAHYREKLTLEVLADVCHGSAYHLLRTFKRQEGSTPMEYVQKVRLGRAKELLAHSELSVAGVAAAVGIPRSTYFVTLFKKKTGYTPAAYRRSVRGEGGDGG